MIDMIEIGAGGGSIAQLDARGTVKVGPRSAGADPGPACYAQGGEEPTLTDANLILGYLDAGSFLGGEMSLSPERAADAIRSRVAEPLGVTLERAAFGIHEIINEDVARAFRIHASERGFDYRNSAMVAFGGSGPLHALGVARKLRIPKVVFPVAAGVMSALGLLASPLAFEVATTRESHLSDLSSSEFLSQLEGLAEAARQPLLDAGLAVGDIRVQYHLDMRYHGQGHEITVTLTESASMEESWEALPTLFRARYAELYATSQLDTPLVITNWKVEASGPQPELRPGYHTSDYDARAGALAQPHATRRAWFEGSGGWVDTPVYQRYALGPELWCQGRLSSKKKNRPLLLASTSRYASTICTTWLPNLMLVIMSWECRHEYNIGFSKRWHHVGSPCFHRGRNCLHVGPNIILHHRVRELRFDRRRAGRGRRVDGAGHLQRACVHGHGAANSATDGGEDPGGAVAAR